MPRFIKGSQPSLSVICTKNAARDRALGEVARKHWVQTFSDSKRSLGNPEQQTNGGHQTRSSENHSTQDGSLNVSLSVEMLLQTRGQRMSQPCQEDILVADTKWLLMTTVSTQLYCSTWRHWRASEGVCVFACLLILFTCIVILPALGPLEVWLLISLM